jgi:hypothetical protein
VKLPAVAMTAAFACGIALGLCPLTVRLASSQFWLAAGFLTATSLIVAGILLVNRARFGAGAIVSGVSFCTLCIGLHVYRKCEIVALTHAHQDHLGGLAAILENFRVGRLWVGREVSSPTLGKIEQMAKDRQIPIEHETRAKSFAWDHVEGTFFWPEASSSAPSSAAKNDDSLVLRLQYEDRAVLLPGDAERDAEREMLSENHQDRLRADVLKVGHHGSRNSTTPEFLAAVKPRLAVISVGEDNPYGHPNAELLERLANARVRVLRTDRDGAVHILMDGKGLEVRCFLPCLPLGGDELQRAQAPDHRKDEHQQ